MIVYTNSLLATLNARKRIRSAGSAIHTPTDISLFMRDFPTTASVALRVRLRYNTPLPSSGAFEFTEKPDDFTPGLYLATDEYVDKDRQDARVCDG